VETTVPPGTCEHVVAPILDACCAERGMPAGSLLLAHSYERVMPGEQYLESITSFWRVYSGRTEDAAEACRTFLSTVIDTDTFPLRRLAGTTASETAKVLENAYRATNIAFVDEWGRFAERAGVDLYEVIDAIRMRPTHQNIRQPGFGVGGYCLTKDPIFAALASTDLLGLGEQDFPMSELALHVNREMPLHSLRVVENHLGGLAGRTIALAGVSYRQDVADTRYSPAETFVRRAESAGATVQCFDPLVGHWHELDRHVPTSMDACPAVDAVVFAVPHRQWSAIEVDRWLGTRRPFIVDAADCLSDRQRAALAAAGCEVYSIGRGPVSR
jgi:UDP-N-acetyl-D-glucosamine dehydrogenase